MSAPTTTTRPVIDVSILPGSELDHRALIWWGNLLLLVIETTMFALLIAAYYYVRGNVHDWPPPQTNWAIARYDTNPALPLALTNLTVIVLSCVPMAVADRMAFHMRTAGTVWGLAGCIALGLVAIGLRFKEFFGLNFRWDDNAYGSMVWMLLGMHLLHLIVGTLENSIMITWIGAHGMDEKHARDIRVNAVYWYWIGAMWVLLFAIVYLSPRLT